MKSTDSKHSRYNLGGITEEGEIGFEWWERLKLSTDPTDRVYIVKAGPFAGRLDRISTAFYGTSRLWWIIAQVNNILDPEFEVVPGRVIYVPSNERARAISTRRGGTVRSTKVKGSRSMSPVVV